MAQNEENGFCAVDAGANKTMAVVQRFANISGRGAAVFLRSAFLKISSAESSAQPNDVAPRSFKGTGFEGLGVYGGIALLSHDKLATDVQFHQHLTLEATRMPPAQAARFAAFCTLAFASMSGAPGIAERSRETRLNGVAPVIGDIWLRSMTALPAPEAYNLLTQPDHAIWAMADHPAMHQRVEKLFKKLELHLPAENQPHLARMKDSLRLG